MSTINLYDLAYKFIICENAFNLSEEIQKINLPVNYKVVFIDLLIKMNVRRNDYYKPGRNKNLENFLQSDYFYKYFVEELLPLLLKATQNSADITGFKDKKGISDLTLEEWFDIGGINMLPLLLQVQTGESIKLLNSFLTSFPETSQIVNVNLLQMTSLPFKQDATLNKEAFLEPFHLLNVYTKLAIINPDAAYVMAVKTLELPEINVESFVVLLNYLSLKCYVLDESIDIVKANDNNNPKNPTQTEKLKQSFFQGLPIEVQEKILEIPFLKKKFGRQED